MISIAVSLAGSGIAERVSLLWKKFILNKNSVRKNFIEIIGLSITSITKYLAKNFVEIIDSSITSITRKDEKKLC